MDIAGSKNITIEDGDTPTTKLVTVKAGDRAFVILRYGEGPSMSLMTTFKNVKKQGEGA